MGETAAMSIKKSTRYFGFYFYGAEVSPGV
jgi:hypothetical protein